MYSVITNESMSAVEKEAAFQAAMIRAEIDRAAAERLGLTARAAEYATQISVLRGKLEALNNQPKGEKA